MKHLREFVTLLQMADIDLKQGEPMCRHTTFQIGGPVAVMAFPNSPEQVGEILKIARRNEITPMILGAGSNILAPDEGLDTVVIELRTAMNRVEERSKGEFEAQAGAAMARLATFAMERGYTGLEFAHGIPGTMGGGVFMNAGAYEGEMSQVVDWVDCLDEEGMPRRLSREALALGYRSSIFLRRPWLITGAHLTLAPGDPAAIREKMADLSRRRRAKQPLEYPSAGSTFKRPAGHFAGGLIEQCGLKGTTVGGAQVSEKHAGFVINTGQATCQDILTLIRLVRDRVFQQTGVRLEPEVRLLGCTLEEP